MISTEEKVLNAAVKEFSRYGFSGARVDRIAKTARINKAMIYYHFKSKEQLYESVLAILADGIYGFIKGLVPDGKADINQIYSILSMYIDYVNNLDEDLIRIILREISSGGKYFRKIIFRRMLQPISSLMIENIGREIENKAIRAINPYYTFLQIVGSVVFFNMMKIALQGTELYNIIYKKNFVKEFSDNLIDILKHGIEPKEQRQ